MRYKTKFNLLRDEVVKANNELVDNKVFETYMDKEQGTIMITNAIVKALVKTIKFYEQENLEAKENLEEEQVWRKDAVQVSYRLGRSNTKLERENEELKNELEEISELYNTKVDEIKQLKNDIEYQERKNDKLTDANLKQFSTIQERNNEIDALKHMLDRKDV